MTSSLRRVVSPSSDGRAPSTTSHTGALSQLVNEPAAFHASWYGPQNATLVAVGDVDPAQMNAQIEKYFGPIPRRATPVVATPSVAAPSAIRLEVAACVTAVRVAVDWLVPGVPVPDRTLEVLQETLAGRTTRVLQWELGERLALATNMSASYSDRRLATTHFVKGATKLACVMLEVRCNHVQLLGGGGPYGPTCDAPTTCVAGACASSDLPPLPDYYADWAKNPPSACGTGAPELTIGQGERTLQPLADGATVRLEEGPQCGHHMWLSLRMKNLAQAGTITTLSATQPGTGITVPATAYPYAWGPSGGGTCDLVGLRFQLDVSDAKAADFLGHPLDLKVEAKDKAGHTVTSLRHVMVDTVMTLAPGRNCPGGPGSGGGAPGGGG